MLLKLPDWLVRKWNNTVADSRTALGKYPNFDTSASFISREANKAVDPISSLDTLERERMSSDSGGKRRKQGLQT